MKLRGFDEKFRAKFKDRKPVVLFAGNDEHQDKSGFIQDLEKVCKKLYLFYKDDGSYGTSHYGFANGRIHLYKEANSYVNTTKILEILENANPKVDFLIIQGWGWNYTPRDLLGIKHAHKDLKILNLQMDDRHTYDFNNHLGTHAILPFIDVALSTAPERIEHINKEGTPAFYFPLASSTEFYYPLENVKKKYDIGFVGGNYGIRAELIQALKDAGLNVKAYGNGFGGRIALEETNQFFNECEIVLGVGGIGNSLADWVNMKLRDFDAPMSGGAYLTTYNPDLEKLFSKDSMIFYKDKEDLISKAKYYLEHKNELEQIRKQAFKEASTKHTYEKRLKDMFLKLGIEI
ncbi:glycosyltransferase [Helicobacter cetorum]|uniref:glycosyltransferase family protein n=1 Tax=Helicobacter cetorum TaxID=138563 RepID=UPI001E5D129A|nr:glycosyltransferase [Helicobacter cetorum]